MDGWIVIKVNLILTGKLYNSQQYSRLSGAENEKRELFNHCSPPTLSWVVAYMVRWFACNCYCIEKDRLGVIYLLSSNVRISVDLSL